MASTLASLPLKISSRLHGLSRRLLCFAFGLDPWHAGLPASRRYPADIAAHLNSRLSAARGSAAEIGCGLGDIARRLRFGSVDCFDREPRVLSAAALLGAFSPGRRSFRVLDFPSSMPSGSYDAVLLVNWIHNVEPEALRAAFSEIYRNHLAPGGELVFDTVSGDGYLHHHDASALCAGLGGTLSEIGRYERGRTVCSFSKPHES